MGGQRQEFKKKIFRINLRSSGASTLEQVISCVCTPLIIVGLATPGAAWVGYTLRFCKDI